MRLDFTSHAENMLKERNIHREWVYQTVMEPSFTEKREDGTIHYLKPITENAGRTLRVVTNQEGQVIRVVTVFFDRRAGRQV